MEYLTWWDAPTFPVLRRHVDVPVEPHRPLKPSTTAGATSHELATMGDNWESRRAHRTGAPVRLSLDNGSECRCQHFDEWAHRRHVALHVIQPGKPIQNSHIESFTGRLRDECLHQHWFLSLRDAQFPIERWRRSDNTDRPHAACVPLTPDAYARTFRSPAQMSA